MKAPLRSELSKLFGEIKDGAWAKEGLHCAVFNVPPMVADVWKNSNAGGSKTARIYCNKAMHPALTEALGNLVFRGYLKELNTFDGGFNIRDVRGVPGRLSTHAYGLAIDLNAAENPLGSESKLSWEFVKCWTDAGFVWGGVFSRPDPMHFQFVVED